ncbi:serine/threonine-protein kinase [Pseudofrankia sp. BMG5.36]|uniref:WD40 repeat domain-containing serine/threonine protein kinase n=1 Tax=Pseudofrankia sp. BMG5.36 TaxID=1834512 RepID=UPI0008DAFB96|nr:serine/threonine-protein kinase [Pseudofrankia sp. BMG5.36]OHV45534.1 hypothetical protein BCD48_22330 [Pseudofrankia sp. BMG5.36]
MVPTLPLDEDDPTSVGPYDLLGRLGDGGMGSVYLARRRVADGSGEASGAGGDAGPLVALKVIRPDLARIPEFRERFLREARSAQRVARFCTAEVIDVSTVGRRPYLVTEFIDGPTLFAAVRAGGPLPPAELERLAVAVASALTAIHAAGIVHRDLKPGNILLSGTGARVIDFGISRALDVTATLTHGSIGTPGFMAPEQALGRPVSEAADVYAWGAVVLFAASGRPPFEGDSTPVVLRRVVDEAPDLSSVHGALRPLVARAMSKDPAYRPAADELLLLLHRLAARPPRPAAAGPTLPDAGARLTPPPTPPPPMPAGSVGGDGDADGAGVPVTSVVTGPAGPPRATMGAAPDPDAVTRRAPWQGESGPFVPPPGGVAGGVPAAGNAPRRRGRRRLALVAAPAAVVLAGVVTAVVLTARDGGGDQGSDGAGQVVCEPPAGGRVLEQSGVASSGSGNVHAVAFSPDGRTLAVGGDDQAVRLWDVSEAARPSRVGGTFATTGIIEALAFSPDGGVLATSGFDAAIRLWDVTDRARPREVGEPLTGQAGPVGAVVFSADGRLLASSGFYDAARLWDVSDPAHGRLAARLPVGDTNLVALEGGRLATAGVGAGLWDVSDPARPRPVATLAEGVQMVAVALSADGGLLATTTNSLGGHDRTRLWDVSDPAHPTSVPVADGAYRMVFSPDGDMFAAAGCWGVGVWDVTDPARPVLTARHVAGPEGGAASLALSPDGRLLATGNGDGTARLWSVP